MLYRYLNVKKIFPACLLLFICFSNADGQTIAEKKAGLGVVNSDLTSEMQETLKHINVEHAELENELKTLYSQAMELFDQQAPECSYKELLDKINIVKDQIAALQTNWRETVSLNQKDEYALWHQPNTTLDQLIFDYGSQDFIYLVPPEIADIPISVNSNLPIPRSSWSEVLELILSQNGVGVRQLNPFLRQLYLIQEDNSGLSLITNSRADLLAFPSTVRVAFVLSPEPADVRRTWFFLEKFINPNTTVLQMIGRDILIVAPTGEVLELLKLYDFISANRGDKDYKVITLSRVDADEMANILGTIFGVLSDEGISTTEMPKMGVVKPKNASPIPPKSPPSSRSNGGDDNGLKIIPLSEVAHAIFLVGTREELRKAENIIREVEEQVGESRGRVIYWYNAKHSDAEELADILSRVYYLIVSSGAGYDGDEDGPPGPDNQPIININGPDLPPPPPLLPQRRPYEQGFFLDDSYVVNNRPPVAPPPVNVGRDNFIVDAKSGAIVMVVEAEILPRLKELIRKLDVPKKMVQIEVLLFEKKLNRTNNFGLNLLKIGAAASNKNATSALFNVRTSDLTPLGIFEFLISREKHGGIPAYDLSYRFLLAQEDIHINASPSVLAINQTPAMIEISEEISVNTGIYAVDTPGGVTLQNAFARARYGIRMEIIPTIHLVDEPGEITDSPDYVTLETDITFQTINPSGNAQQPDVTTRHVINDVRIPDGQTVILGGLRQRNTRSGCEKIPFLGEIPGVGKLFSLNELEDDTTEMFIFITPKIVLDPVEDLERIRCREMCRRPGDIPAFLCRLVAAEEWEKERLFNSTLTVLFGRRPDRCICPSGEYDGR